MATQARLRLLAQLVTFACVGLVGLAIDTAIVYGLRAEVGLYVAGLVSYVVAATATWVLNRNITFRGLGSGPAHRQWGLFLVANLAGFVLNRGTYAALVTWSAAAAADPVIATASGAVAGMMVNFTLSRALVFR
ncbi:MAG TPA: GtrA family protein [Acidisphaera sp.]|nr:GtrA family protein [Acidisphaera sp.]